MGLPSVRTHWYAVVGSALYYSQKMDVSKYRSPVPSVTYEDEVEGGTDSSNRTSLHGLTNKTADGSLSFSDRRLRFRKIENQYGGDCNVTDARL